MKSNVHESRSSRHSAPSWPVPCVHDCFRPVVRNELGYELHTGAHASLQRTEISLSAAVGLIAEVPFVNFMYLSYTARRRREPNVGIS